MSIQVTPIPQLIELAAPAYTLGTANTAGSAGTAVASDSTLLMFDAVAVDAITLGQSGSVGTASVPPRRDHAHAMEAVTAATQAEMEAASSTTVFVTPGRSQFHPDGAKFWAVYTTMTDPPTASVKYNITSLSDGGGAGDTDWVIADDFSSDEFVIIGGGNSAPAMPLFTTSSTAGTFTTIIRRSYDNTSVDSYDVSILGFGTLA